MFRFGSNLVALFLFTLVSATSYAQTPREIQSILADTAEALGMKRGPDNRRTLDPITRAFFVANGSMSELGADGQWQTYALENYRQDMNYRLPAIRQHISRMDSNGKQKTFLRVARETFAWDEAELGKGITPVDSANAAARLRLVWIMPQGFWASVVRANPGDVKFKYLDEGSRVEVSTTINGERATAILGEDKRPEQIDIAFNHPSLGETKLTAKYSGYKDFNYYEVIFPATIEINLGQHTLYKLEVTDHHNGGYLVWPIPAQMQAKN